MQSRKRQTDEVGALVQRVQVGGDENCLPTDNPCNGPLNPESEYSVRYRLFSEDGVGVDYPFSDQVFTTREMQFTMLHA